MIFPGLFVSILTFPGVIVHELAHQLFCYMCNIKVNKVVYFQFGNKCMVRFFYTYAFFPKHR